MDAYGLKTLLGRRTHAASALRPADRLRVFGSRACWRERVKNPPVPHAGSSRISPRTRIECARPYVKLTSSRNCVISSQPACRSEGVMNLVQMSRSLNSFLFIKKGVLSP